MDPPPRPTDRQAIRLAPGAALEDHLVPGKATCIVFLRAGRPASEGGLDLDELGRREGLAVRTIEIEDWSSPIRKRFDVQSAPWLVLFDREGRRVAAGYDRSVLDRLEDLR